MIPKQRRVFLQFLLTIGLPCLVLGYFAYRGVLNDRALLEKEQNDRAVALAYSCQVALEDSLVGMEQRFASLFARFSSLPRYSSDALLDSIQASLPCALTPFIITTNGDVVGCSAAGLYRPDDDEPELLDEDPTTARQLKEAESAEFQRQNLSEALRLSETGLALGKEWHTRGRMLLQKARVLRKMSRGNEALPLYASLLESNPKASFAGGIPLRMIAQRETGMTYLECRDTTNALNTFIDLTDDIAAGNFLLTKSAFQYQAHFVDSMTRELLARSASTPNYARHKMRLDGAQAAMASRINATESVLQLSTINLSSLVLSPSDPVKPEDPSWIRIPIELREHQTLALLRALPAQFKVTNIRLYGFVLDEQTCRTDLLQPIVQQVVLPENTCWTFLDSRLVQVQNVGERVAAPPFARVEFPSGTPLWTLEIQQLPPAVMGSMFGGQRPIYGYFFAMIGVVLVLGFVLTLRSVSQEMSLAKLKYDFVSTISHEFRSPLTSVRQLSEMLRLNRVPSPSRRQQYLDVIVEQCERLSVLVESVLDYAKMEDGRENFEFEEMDIAPLLQNVSEHFRKKGELAGFQFTISIPISLPPVRVDRMAIAQVLTNLLDNAVKYSGNTRQITVEATADKTHLSIAVQDRGIGIEKQDVRRIFERFYRGGDPHTRPTGGTGLGLTLVQHFVHVHHGRVFVQTEPGKGSTFTVRLPVVSR